MNQNVSPMTDSPQTPVEQLKSCLPATPKRFLLIKALPDEKFLPLLEELRGALSGAGFAVLGSGTTFAGKFLEGELIPTDLGFFPLASRLAQGFDVCLVAAGEDGIGGVRLLQADIAALLAHSRRKFCCTPTRLLSRQRRVGIVLAPLASGLKLLFALLAATLGAALGMVIFLLLIIGGDFLSLLIPGGGRPPEAKKPSN
jgi:hypothetical protein